MTIDLNQLFIRSFSPNQDIPRLLDLYNAVEAVDQIGNVISEQALRDQLGSPGHDPLRDRWVVESPDEPSKLIGSALVKVIPETHLTEGNIAVHPGWRHQGVGSALLIRVMDHARVLDSTALLIYASAGHPDAAGFLQKRGFIAQGAYTELRLTEGIRLPPVIWPFGYTMRPYGEIGDVSLLTEVLNLAYIPLWGHHAISQEEITSWLTELNPDGIFLVFSEKGRGVGISRVDHSPERSLKNGLPTGYIDAPGIVPQHRRLDLYRALVLTGIAWLHQQGQALVEMESWGDKLEVLKMYRELGFKDLRQLVCYQFDLTKADQAG